MKKNILKSAIIFFLVLFAYYIFSEDEGIYSSYDAASFAIATNDYNLQENLPHMPGYYLHIKLINIAKIITGSTHSAMVWLNLLCSAFGAVFSFQIFRKFLNDNEAFILTAVVVTNPMTWYYGCSTGVYPFDLFYSTLIILLLMNRKMIYLAPVILTLGAGVRQSSGFFMLPVVIYFFIVAYKEKKLKIIPSILAILLALAGFLIWVMPMLDNAGGIANYLELFQRNSPLSMRHAFIKNLTNALTYGLYIFIPVFFIILSSISYKNKPISLLASIKKGKFSKIQMLILLWPVPITVFFLLFVYSKGYFLICITGVFLIAAYMIAHKLIKIQSLIILIFFQMIFFLFMPYSDANLYVNMATDKREVSKIDAWVGRLSNVFMLSQDAIRTREQHTVEINKCINNLEQNGYLKDHTIFIDPSFPIKARVLQAVYPDIKFAFLNVYDNDSYFFLHNTNFYTRFGLNEILSKSIILTSKKYYESYLIDNGFSLIFQSSDIICFDPDSKIESIIEVYYDHYIRSD